MSDIDFNNLDLNFGAVKPLPKIPEGEYAMRIVDWQLSRPKSEDSAKKGFNLKVKYQFVNSEWEDEEGNVHDISKIQPNEIIFIMPDNPFAIVSLASAVLNLDKEDPNIGEKLQERGISISDASQWIGEQVIVRLVRSPDGKYLNPAQNSHLPVGF